MKKQILTAAIAIMAIGATAQEKVRVHNGTQSYVTEIEYITFDATEADQTISVDELQKENTQLSTEKAALVAEKATLASEKTTLEGQVNTLTQEKAALESQVTTLTSEKAELAAELLTMKDQMEKTGTIGHAYVDLGLTSGTLWATTNIGANSPEDYGDYYAWGETETHYYAGYTWSTYKWCNGSLSTMAKYCTSSSYGKVDNKTELDDADDVAVQTWGGAWKMPTYEQQTELRDECYWVWINTYNGESVSGYIVYKAKNDSDKGVKVSTPSADYDVASDAHIFLPAAGSRQRTNLSDAGSSGYYWSRSLCAGNSNFAYDLYFYSSRVVGRGSNDRYFGYSVRPVCKP